MARNKEEKITVNPAQTGLNSAFSSLLANVPTVEGKPAPEMPPEPPFQKTKKGRVVLRKETAHRGGKTVIVVYDFESRVSSDQIETLGKQLRKACGCGGTVKDREIEIQGEHARKIRQFLQAEGFHVAGI